MAAFSYATARWGIPDFVYGTVENHGKNVSNAPPFPNHVRLSRAAQDRIENKISRHAASGTYKVLLQ